MLSPVNTVPADPVQMILFQRCQGSTVKLLVATERMIVALKRDPAQEAMEHARMMKIVLEF